jgi:hypothetical protein
VDATYLAYRNTRKRKGKLPAIAGPHKLSRWCSTRDEASPRKLWLVSNFWVARCYATDGGREAVRMAIQEADRFEAFAADSAAQASPEAHWENGLHQNPENRETRASVELLRDSPALERLRARVRAAKTALIELTTGGIPCGVCSAC